MYQIFINNHPIAREFETVKQAKVHVQSIVDMSIACSDVIGVRATRRLNHLSLSRSTVIRFEFANGETDDLRINIR